MKVPTPEHLIDPDAPVLPAKEVVLDEFADAMRWRVWCKYCQLWHYHGPLAGHRIAHCKTETPYSTTGYNLALKD